MINWPELFAAARLSPGNAVNAVTYLGPTPGSGCGAQLFICGSDTYSVKFIGNGHGTRMLANEQVVGTLGIYLEAPIPPIAHVTVPQELIEANGIVVNGVPAIAGVHHGSRWEDDCSGRLWIETGTEDVNRVRFAALCVLYSWVAAGDRQLIYKNQPPRLVFSVDHGHFFPGGPPWSVASLSAAGPPVIDADLAAAAGPGAYGPTLARLADLSSETVAGAISRIHPSWGVPDDDLAALARFLIERAAQTVQLFQ